MKNVLIITFSFVMFISIGCMIDVPEDVNHNVSEVRHVITIEVPLSYQNECEKEFQDVIDEELRQELVDQCINDFFDQVLEFVKSFGATNE